MIKLQNLSCGYPGHQVLDRVNLEIPSGQIIAVIGQNGSGKSTLAQILSGLKNDFRGNIFLDELKLTRRLSVREIRQKVGIVLQNPEHQILFNQVNDDLAFILNNLKIPRAEHSQLISSALARVGMLDFLKADSRQLSGGQKQRLVIASAILANPEYLIFDEATSMLDLSAKRSIYQILQDFKTQNITSLLMTNWLDEIVLADQVLILDSCKIYMYSCAEVFNYPEILVQHGLDTPPLLQLAARHQMSHEEILCSLL